MDNIAQLSFSSKRTNHTAVAVAVVLVVVVVEQQNVCVWGYWGVGLGWEEVGKVGLGGGG